ncbi:TIGR02710 family CRISPR-associated CARF protein [Candidatus Manganitrophus noduliformans]|uniref:TIGR02710 family CRISPR-associated protein n=1 Tax=Candidatus Manganitrophus noduliformans TaxID=2606439 RepID=A0A7X6IC18_9BACT|nr:TIGR02710 family CRISPR-associated CARF protein [Candidatus Manganitrophus noduliformans]NKE72009.1 TIGR02710 family CRISPR-associated protein [Candidatus Manganitrophus noduliformans]
MSQSSVKALLVSVGGDLASTIFAINRLRPEALCFFVAEAEQGEIDREIIPQIEQPPRQWDQIVTPDSEDLLQCCRVLLREIPGLLSRWGVEPSQLTIDTSGGTKTMAAALALCAVDAASSFHAVVSKAQAKGGTETAVRGEARVLYQGNPWDELAANGRRDAAAVFNQARYREAADLFRKIEKRVSGGSKPLYKSLADFSEGYAFWDAFDYREGWNRLQSAKKGLEMSALFGGPPGLKDVVAKLKENLSFLEKLVMGTKEIKPELFLDLLANAQRRAHTEKKYEEATVRLLRALEVLAQARLAERGFQFDRIDPDPLPASLKTDFIQKYTSPLDGRIKPDLLGDYRLLKEIGDPLGIAFDQQWSTFKIPLEARERSILGHGFTPMPPDRYQHLWELALKISGTLPEKMLHFPKMEF